MSSKRIITFVSLLSLLVFTLGFTAHTTYAETYDVNAFVPYETPSQPAVINSPADGATFNDVQRTVSGTCQIQNPATVVSIWRSGSSLGSAPCLGGSFSITVILSIGQNTLTARTANANGIYGPDSVPKSFTVTAPIPAKPLPPAVQQPTTDDDRTAATNQAELSGLSLEVETPFLLLPTSKQATVRIVVNGGKQPYTLQLKWGDGSIESHSLKQPGTYEFTHTYLVHKTYTVYAYVRDVFGSYTEYMYAVISGNKTPNQSANSSNSGGATQNTGPWKFAGIAWYYWLLLVCVIIFLISSYWLGYRYGKNRSSADVKEQSRRSKPKKTKSKKK